MKVLCVGDVVGAAGMETLCRYLPNLKTDTGADFVIVNGENSDASGVGLTKEGAQQILGYADVITTGNHCYRKADESMYTDMESVLHPANYPFTEDEAGCCQIDMGRLGTIRVINLMGVAFMEPIDSPFACVDRLLAKSDARFTIVDFHAEATSEKKALAFYLDGRVSAVFGTHTHVQTADEQVLPKGTGYITVAGMTGPLISIIGVEPELAVKKQREHRPVRFKVAEGPCMLNGVLFHLDDNSGLCIEAKRINLQQSTPP